MILHLSKVATPALLLIISAVFLTFGVNPAAAQQTRSLFGEVSLDVGVAPKDLAIDVTVNNHAFVVVPPTLTIIRPITSKQTRRITIKKGEASATYFVDNIITDNPPPIDYTVSFKCVACSDVFRTQYYAESGNRFGFANDVYLDPATLGASLDINIVSDVRLSGTLNFENGAASKRALNFEIVISDPVNSSVIYLRRSNIILLQGQSSVNYQVTGLRRQTGNRQFSVGVVCTNCFGDSAKLQLFPQILSTSENHLGIDFLVTDQAPKVVAPIIDLLL